MYAKYFKNRANFTQDDSLLWNDTTYETRVEILIQTHIKMISKIANRYRNFGLSVDDLTQEGVIGLIHAAERYKPSMETAFFGYAQLWIKGAIQNFVLSNWSIVRNARQGQKKYFLREVQYTQKALEGYAFSFQKDVSINHVIEDTHSEIQDYLIDLSESSFESQYFDEHRLENIGALLGEVINSLKPMERQVILAKFFLKECETNFPEKKRARLESQALRKMFVYFRTNTPLLRKLVELWH